MAQIINIENSNKIALDFFTNIKIFKKKHKLTDIELFFIIEQHVLFIKTNRLIASYNNTQ